MATLCRKSNLVLEPNMAKVSGLNRIIKLLERLRKQSKTKYRASVTVGFTQSYALPVHEMVMWKHRVGQAKYLTVPLQAMKSQLRIDAISMITGGAKVSTALLVLGLQVQRAAQKLTPVDTGALKASAFTSLTKNVEAASAAAYNRGEARRAKVLAKRGKTP